MITWVTEMEQHDANSLLPLDLDVGVLQIYNISLVKFLIQSVLAITQINALSTIVTLTLQSA